MSGYEVEMVFKASTSIPVLNDIAEQFAGARPVAKDAFEIELSATLEELPGEDQLAEMAKALEKAYNSKLDGRMRLEGTCFSHYAKAIPLAG